MPQLDMIVFPSNETYQRIQNTTITYHRNLKSISALMTVHQWIEKERRKLWKKSENRSWRRIGKPKNRADDRTVNRKSMTHGRSRVKSGTDWWAKGEARNIYKVRPRVVQSADLILWDNGKSVEESGFPSFTAHWSENNRNQSNMFHFHSEYGIICCWIKKKGFTISLTL